MFNVVLIEPEIPPNTGNIARLCLATRSRLHLVEPLGFSVNDRQLRRAGMDYWHLVDVQYWKSLAEFETVTRPPLERRFLLTTKSTRKYWEAKFREGDYLVFGRETKGLPESLLLSNAENCLTIPMVSDARSLNLATAVAIVLFEGIRQIHCDGD
ncbi:MAG: tRNA (cytidine(34)-2'-O)-methyltransferase [Verrucomicrobia bacterium]|nr:tRNA (cytidine(34)-2'-O)-methyltransferase [Verrucomicrobiota bacterium]